MPGHDVLGCAARRARLLQCSKWVFSYSTEFFPRFLTRGKNTVCPGKATVLTPGKIRTQDIFFFAASRPFCIELSPSVYWHACFYVAALSNINVIFFPLNFVSGDLALTGVALSTWTSNFNCVGALWVWPVAQTRPHVLAWHMGSDYSYCIALDLEQKCHRGLAIVFPWIARST